MPRIKFYGEGPDDVGREIFKENLATLQILIKRILAKNLHRDIDFDYEINHIKDVKLHPKKYKGKGARGFARKVSTAMEYATDHKYDAVVFVVDYDEHTERFEEMDEGRKTSRQRDCFIPVVLGVAKKEIEAWLLADPKARRQIFGTKGGDDIGEIETRDNLTKLFGDLYSEYQKNQENEDILTKGKIKRELAEISNIGTIAKECNKSFKPFMKEVKDNLKRLFKGNQ